MSAIYRKLLVILAICEAAHGYGPGTRVVRSNPKLSLVSRRSLLAQGLGWTTCGVISQISPAGAASSAQVTSQLISRGGGQPVKDGDYVFIDFVGHLDSFDGPVIDTSEANGGQSVKVVIGDGDDSPAGLLANVGRGGTLAKPVTVPMPLGINDVLRQGVAPRNEDGSLATQTSAVKDYPDAPTVGSKYKIIIPPERAFGQSGGVTGSGGSVPPGATLYYTVRIRTKTGKLQVGF